MRQNILILLMFKGRDLEIWWTENSQREKKKSSIVAYLWKKCPRYRTVLTVYLRKADFMGSKKTKEIILSVDFAKEISCPCINFLHPVFFFSSEVIIVALWLNFANTCSRVLSSALPGLLQQSHAVPRLGPRDGLPELPGEIGLSLRLVRDWLFLPTPSMSLALSELWARPKSKQPNVVYWGALERVIWVRPWV